jgi:ArsR family transcriptional regulator
MAFEPHPPVCGARDVPDPAPLTPERIAEIAKGLAHPVRVRILEQFAEHTPHTAQEIVDEFDLAQSTISEHLRILRKAGLLIPTHDGPRTWHCLRRALIHQFAHTVVDLADEGSEPAECCRVGAVTVG